MTLKLFLPSHIVHNNQNTDLKLKILIFKIGIRAVMKFMDFCVVDIELTNSVGAADN